MGCIVCNCCIKMLNRGSSYLGYTPEKFWTHASEDAKELVLACLKDIDADKILDCHVHCIAIGPKEKNGCYIHENWYDECCHPKSAIKRRAIIITTGHDIDDSAIDEYYMENLTECFAHFLPPGSDACPKASLLGMDEWYDSDGTKREDKTTLHVNNHWLEHVIIRKDPEKRQRIFRGAPSIHPYKPTACEELRYWHKKGARQIKWLPNSQGIDPMSPLCDKFYETMQELDMWLLSHTGTEHVLNEAGAGEQHLGNPCRLERPLKMGVNVIAAHCASVGYFPDLMAEKVNGKYPVIQSMKLVFKLMRKYNNLYTDISGSTSFTRTSLVYRALKATDLHDRMIFATDFPLPAIQVVVWLFCLTIAHDLIPLKCVPLLREIYLYNPVLSDFVRKRIMRHKDEHGQVYRFPNKVFEQAPLVYKDRWRSTSLKQRADAESLTVQISHER